MAGFGSGILMWLGVNKLVQTTIIIILIGMTVLSILVLFENRYTILASSSQVSSQVRKSLIGFLYVFALFYFIPFTLLVPNQEIAVPALLEKLPSIRCFYTGPIFVLMLDATVVGWTTTFKLFIEFLFILILGILSYLNMKDQNKNINLSRKTLALQKKLFMSLIFQTGIPFSVIVLPLVYCAYSVVFDYYSQAMNNVCFLIISNHGLLTTLAIMIIHKPYRKAAFPCVNRRKKNKTELISVVLPTFGGKD